MAQVTKDLPDWIFGYALLPRTALRPNQEPYFMTTIIEVSAKEFVAFVIGAGYSPLYKWVPEGRRFSIWYLSYTANQNSLIEVGIKVEKKEEPGVYTGVATKFGYGEIEFLSGILCDFEYNTRPVYYIENYSDVKIRVALTLFGIEEVVL